MKIKITWLAGEAVASLRDTETSNALLAILPISASARTWGDEVYFEVPVDAKLESDAEQVVPAGTVGFWTEGSCLAIPFGSTPISVGDECRLAARVNILGQLDMDPRVLKTVTAGETITVSILGAGKS